MYENRFGRFTAGDPLLASGRSANTQTFNRYAYVINRPLSLTDPSGMDPCWKGNCSNGGCEYKESKDSPGKGWNQVDFAGYFYHMVPKWNDTGRTRYLYAGGGDDFGETYSLVMNIAIKDEPLFFNIGGAPVPNPATTWARVEGLGVGSYNFADGIPNLPFETPLFLGTPTTLKYTYNFSGALIEEEYPSGRKVKNEFDSKPIEAVGEVSVALHFSSNPSVSRAYLSATRAA
jgi:hypothetical protein